MAINWAGKKACIVITTDDGWLPTLENSLALSKIYPFIKMTHYLPTGDISNEFPPEFINQNPEIVRQLYFQGHEIGGHTHNHKNISLLTDNELTENLSQNRQTILQYGIADICSMSYPYGGDVEPTKYELIRPYFSYARDTAQQDSYIKLNKIDNQNNPIELFKIPCRNAGWDKNNETADEWFRRIVGYTEEAIINNACIILLWHYIDEVQETGYGTIKRSMIEQYFNYLQNMQEYIWFPTLSQALHTLFATPTSKVVEPVTDVNIKSINQNQTMIKWNKPINNSVVEYRIINDNAEIGRTGFNCFLTDNLIGNLQVISIDANGNVSESVGVSGTYQNFSWEFKWDSFKW